MAKFTNDYQENTMTAKPIPDWSPEEAVMRGIEMCGLPATSEQVRYFLDLFEPRLVGENTRLVPSTDGVMYEHDPYSRRLYYLASKFIRQPQEFQEFINNVRYDNQVFWRGDSKNMFYAIVGQHLDMVKNPQSYIGNARAILATMRGKK